VEGPCTVDDVVAFFLGRRRVCEDNYPLQTQKTCLMGTLGYGGVDSRQFKVAIDATPHTRFLEISNKQR